MLRHVEVALGRTGLGTGDLRRCKVENEAFDDGRDGTARDNAAEADRISRSLRGRIGVQRRVRAARGEGCFFSILSCFVVRCAVAAQGEKRSRLGGGGEMCLSFKTGM
jgi:hypothetical protein